MVVLSQTVASPRLPKIDGKATAPRPLSKIEGPRMIAPPRASPRAMAADAVAALSPRLRPKRRQVPPEVRAAQLHLWQSEVKHWCELTARNIQGSGWAGKEEEDFSEWFTALDIDMSGTIEDNEIRALMTALGLTPEPGQIRAMFAAVDKTPDESLSRGDFVRFMMANMAVLKKSVNGHDSSSDAPSSANRLFDANTRLMMLAYRRSRLLEDIADPQKRRNFRDVESFNVAYGRTLGLGAAAASARGPAAEGASLAAPAVATPRRQGVDRGRSGTGGYWARSPRLPRIAPSPRPPSSCVTADLLPSHGRGGVATVPVWNDDVPPSMHGDAPKRTIV